MSASVLPAAGSLAQPCCGGAGTTIHVPEEFPLSASSFIRTGSDLRIVAPDGHSMQVNGFFDSTPLPDLARSEHAWIAGTYVASLAERTSDATGGISHHGIPDPLAHIDAVGGNVSIIRSSGAVEAAASGSVLHNGDFLQVVTGGASVALADGRTLGIVERGQIMLHRMATGGDTSHASVLIDAAGGRFVVIPPAERPASGGMIQTPAGQLLTGSAFTFRHGVSDGLQVSFLDADGIANNDSIIVENDFGRAVITDANGVITVADADQPPVATRTIAEMAQAAETDALQAALNPASDGTQPESMEFSPGGDLDAFTGDPIVVTGAPAVFDLTPMPARLQDPEFSGILAQSSSAPPIPRHYTIELFSYETLQTSESSTTTGSTSSTIPHGKQLRDWEPLGLVWDVMGSADVSPMRPDLGHPPPYRTISPTEAQSMAMMQADPGGMGPVDDFLGLPLLTIFNKVPGVTPVGSSAIRSSPLQITAGTELSFDFFFDAANESPRSDFAVFTIDGRAFKLADSVATGLGGATGWRTFVYQVTRTDTYTLGFVAVNDLTSDDPSRLLVDNVRLGRTFGSDYLQIDAGAGWRTLVQGPTLRDDTLVTTEDAATSTTAAALLANDTDPDLFDPMGVIGIDRVGTRGTPRFSSDGTVTFDPAGQFESLSAGETATTSFRYEVDAGNGVTGFATVRATVIGVNDAPTVRADAETVAAESVHLFNVLANDDDVDSDDDRSTLRIVAAQAATGTVSFTGQPGAGLTYGSGDRFRALGIGETALDTITYTLEDRHGARSTGTVTVTVTGLNDAPTAADDTAATNEDAPTTLTVLSNDADPDVNDRLGITAIVVNGTARPIAVGGQVTLASGAVLTLGAGGLLTYDPRGHFDSLAAGSSTVETFRYQVADGHGGTAEAEARITIAGRNDTPIALADVASADENGVPVSVSALANDDDVDTDDDQASLHIVAAQAASGATVTFSGLPGAGLVYDPSGRFERLGVGETATDTILYTLEDSHGARVTAPVTVTVRGSNDTPIAVADTAIASEDASISIAPLANDRDPDENDRPRITAIIVNGTATPIASGGQVTLTSGAVVTLSGSDVLVYDPSGRFDRLALGETAADSFGYRIDDGHGGTAESSVTLRIDGSNDAPTAAADNAAAAEDGPAVTIDVLANDDDIDSDDARANLRIIAAQAASGAAVTFDPTAGSAGLRYNAAGRFDRLAEGETATDTITYRIVDRHGAVSDGQVTVTVSGANDAPTATADTLMIDATSVLRLPASALTANDRDPDTGDRLTIIAVNGAAINVGRTITLASGALLTVSADGSLVYDPNGRFDGLTDFERATDTFTYAIADTHGATSSTTATVQIQGRNDPPSATADTALTDEDCAVRIPVMINDSDPDAGGNLRVLEIDSIGTRGQVRINADGTVTYNPNGAFDQLQAGEQASDTFRYVLDDFVGGRSIATVTVTVIGKATASTASHQELIQSFEVPPLPNAVWSFLGSVRTAADFPLTSGGGYTPTHAATLAVLTASGSQAGAIERYLSDDISIGGRPLISLPTDTVAGSLPNSGAAMRTTIALAAADVAEGRITLAFDWNFVSAESQPALSNLNDYAVFTVTDGITARVFKLADARQTIGEASGWRTSIFDLGSAFTLPQGEILKLTVGFAVLNDETPINPSTLLVDNVRVNRPIASDFELISSASGLATYRERPDALADTLPGSFHEDQSVTLPFVTLLGNDGPSAGATVASLRVSAIDVTGATADIRLTGDGIVWTPAGRFDFLAAGQVATDSFRYTLTDSNGGSSQAQVTMSVIGANDAPVVASDTASATENGAPIAVDVLANDDDVDSDDDRFSLRIVAANAVSGAAIAFAGTAGTGLTYDPRSVAGFEALGEGEITIDSISYTVEDRHGARSSGSVAVTVTGRNDAPSAAHDSAATDEDTAISLAAVTNDSDPDIHDHLSVVAVAGTSIAVGGQVMLASGATVTLEPSGTLRYVPGPAFNALARGQAASDTFTYTVGDGHGGTSQASIDIAIAGRNDAPVAGADALVTNAATRLTAAASTLLSNDFDADAGDSITFLGIDTSGTKGTVSFDGSTVTWDPADQFRGLGEGETAADSFGYRIADHDGAITTGSVNVVVHGVNDAPNAADDAGTTDEDTATNLHVLSNDSDPDTHDTLTITSIDTAGTRGLVTLEADGSITYDPRGHFDALNAGQTDHDTFRYHVSDGHGGTDEASVTVTISGRSDTERLVDSFEAPFSSLNRTGSAVTTATQYQETDGARGLYTPTDGSSLARLEATGSPAATVESFLGLPASSLPRDTPGDNSFPAFGSAFKLKVTVQAGDQISFDWMFDARDFTTSPPDGRADNDFAIFSVVGGTTPELFKLSDVRHTGDQGASGWRSSIYTATGNGELTIGLAVVNDRINGSPVSENSFLLVDNLRLNRDFSSGYQLVDNQADGRFETVVHT